MNYSLPIQWRPTFGIEALSVAKPHRSRLDAFRHANLDAPWSYPDVGATNGELPSGWDPDQHEVVLGGPECFEQAVDALSRWVMFDLPWVWMHPGSGQQPGDLVTFASRQYGVWMMHGCRTVYRIDEPDRVGFGYGTLAGHAVAGEEQFLVTRTDEQTTYAVRKFSRLAHPLARLSGGIARRLQHRFSVESGARMQRECARSSG